MKDIVLFWIQGSGKGTQAKLILKQFPELQYLEPGQIFRALNSNENLISNYVKETVARWEMVSDNLLFDLFDLCTHIAGDKAMLMDGFPRTKAQMEYFLQTEEKNQRDFIAINFDLSQDKAIERIKQRALEQNRTDDVEESIKKRLEAFEKETKPVITSLSEMGKVISLDADQPIEVVFAEIQKILA